MDKKNLKKGDYAYLGKKKKAEVIKTIIFFGIALAVFLTGYLHTGTRNNLLTIVAILGVLPASKSAVSMIMFLRYKPAEEQVYGQLQEYQGHGVILYDLIFVLNQQAVKSECVVIAGMELVVYTKNTKLSEGDISKQLKNFLSNQGKGNCAVKVCKGEKAFLEQAKSRLAKAERNEDAVQKECEIRDKLLAFSM